MFERRCSEFDTTGCFHIHLLKGGKFLCVHLKSQFKVCSYNHNFEHATYTRVMSEGVLNGPFNINFRMSQNRPFKHYVGKKYLRFPGCVKN